MLSEANKMLNAPSPSFTFSILLSGKKKRENSFHSFDELQVWASLLLYRKILDEIEANDYNNFTRRAYVGKAKKILALPIAYTKSVMSQIRTKNAPEKP